MTISVAMAVHNGSKYIIEQLESIANQTIHVDEIVVCDDQSSDNTVKVLQDFQQRTKTVINIVENKEKLGIPANHEKAINLCNGDIVFTADCDDVWYPNKVERTLKWFELNPNKDMVFTDGDIILEDGMMVKGKSLWNCFGFNQKEQNWFDKGLGVELICWSNRVTGPTMAIRNPPHFDFSQGCDGMGQDEILAIIGLQNKSIGYLPEKLIKYRIHEGQASGLGTSLANPMNDVIFSRTSHCERYLKIMLLNDETKKRIQFIGWRSRQDHFFFGWANILWHWAQYRYYYSSLTKDFVKYDLKRSINYSCDRIRKKIRRFLN